MRIFGNLLNDHGFQTDFIVWRFVFFEVSVNLQIFCVDFSVEEKIKILTKTTENVIFPMSGFPKLVSELYFF